jgi:hypothetical protein
MCCCRIRHRCSTRGWMRHLRPTRCHWMCHGWTMCCCWIGRRCSTSCCWTCHRGPIRCCWIGCRRLICRRSMLPRCPSCFHRRKNQSRSHLRLPQGRGTGIAPPARESATQGKRSDCFPFFLSSEVQKRVVRAYANSHSAPQPHRPDLIELRFSNRKDVCLFLMGDALSMVTQPSGGRAITRACPNLQAAHPRPHVLGHPGARACGRAGFGGGRARIVEVAGAVHDGVTKARLVHTPTHGMSA